MAQRNSKAADNHVTFDNAALLPHLESLEKMMKLPVVEAAWHQGQDVYGKVKGHNAVFNWAFRTAEDAVQLAVNTAAPLVQKLDRPIQYVDQTLCTGIDKLEAKAPIIKEQPQQIYNQAKNKVVDVVQPHLSKVCSFRAAGQQKASSLKDLSWQKANEVLATQYGSMAVSGVDTTSALAERLLDYYFPRMENDVEDDNSRNLGIGCIGIRFKSLQSHMAEVTIINYVLAVYLRLLNYSYEIIWSVLIKGTELVDEKLPAQINEIHSVHANGIQPAQMNRIQPAQINEIEPAQRNEIESVEINEIQPAHTIEIESVEINEIQPAQINEIESVERNEIQPSQINEIE